MKSSASLLSPPPSPHLPPLPIASSSSVTHCPELDLTVTHSPTPKTGHTHLRTRPLKTSRQSVQSQLKSHFKRHTGNKSTKVCFEEPVVITVTPEPHITQSRDVQPQQPVRGQRRNRGRHHVKTQIRQTVEPPAAVTNQEPGCLEKAELNTTLALKAELQSLQGVEFNPQKAIQATLQQSERTKNLISTRATEVVNISRSQHLFTSLVSINVQKEEFLSQALQDRLHLAPSPNCQEKAAEGPSLLQFMTSDLFRQKPLPQEEEPISYRLKPSPWPSGSTFDLYNRQRRWEATP